MQTYFNVSASKHNFLPARLVVAVLAALSAGAGLDAGPSVTAADPTMTENRLLDDFSQTDGTSTLGPRWEGFTDRVMGGRSEMQIGYRDSDDGPVLHMQGQVRLENRGGFIQVRLPLDARGGTFDASAWQGVGVRVRGAPGPYYIHLRTRQNWMPWQYYRAPIRVAEDWQEQFIPFDVFEGVSIRRRMDPGALKSLAIVAYGEAFDADIEISRVELVAAPAAEPAP